MGSIEKQRESALGVVKTLQANGYEALFAGGCVRDHLLGRTPSDYDVATNARPEIVEDLFPRTLPLGKAFGVIAVIDGKCVVEVATFRKDADSSDGRRPHSITFCAAKEDALRRDFTINGMFYDPVAEKLIDYVHGKHDLEAEVVRAIGEPVRRFQEDHLRMLRALRFTHTLGFSLEPQTEDAISKMAPLIQQISAERIEVELSRILTESIHPGEALRHLCEVGLLEQFLPEVAALKGVEQPPQFHPEGDVFEHTRLMLEEMKQSSASSPDYTPRELAYAILLHDVGKPPTARMGVGADGQPRMRFNGHASVGADMAEEILIRLKFPNKEKRKIVAAIRGHMRFMEVQKMRVSTLRRMISAESFPLELELHRLDCLGSHRKLDNYHFVQDFIAQLENEPTLPKPWINGNDLIKMGIKPGHQIGSILKEAFDAQMEGRFSDRQALLNWIREQYLPPQTSG